ncbi:TetR/AcrR family transcriptional regulator [Streptomyces lincolnensis]|uniref:TetR/AcrR family transcriptional regulator n=1 Tax=Streptomyces lincolnensis TaxID=1915 RepID=UPI001E45F58B|nr:TetR/AcrR family transcriptional regulator [Streptomyces lincolnensis]MCD7439730.1 TetR/AcrR family transcriptional regulator [Streptomyces lincolnensis]
MQSQTKIRERERHILNVAVELLSEVGFDRLTFDAMAARAGVSKTTLYRRWPTKHELVIDAVRRRVDFSFTVPDQGSFRADVFEALRLVSNWLKRDGAMLRNLVDAIRRDADLREATERQLAQPLDGMWEQVIDRAQGRSELRTDTDPSWLSELAQGVLLNRTLVADVPVTDAFLERLTDEILLPAFTHPA